MSNWSVEDVKSLRIRPEFARYKPQTERAFYRPLAKWLKHLSPTSRVYSDVSEFRIDVIQSAGIQHVGYEVKLPKIFKEHFDFSEIASGIGQALNYLSRGMDRACLVTLQTDYLEDLVSIVSEETPLGMILISKDMNFKQAVEARQPKVKHYSDKDKEILQEMLSMHREV